MNSAQLVLSALNDLKHMKHMSNTTKSIIGGVLIAALSFAGGYYYANRAAAAARQARQTQFAGGFQLRAGRGGAGSALAGTILSMDAQSITVGLQGGGSKIVFVSGSTQVTKSVSGAQSDLATGEAVAVMGAQNPDGSLTAQSIQIRPARAATTTAAAE